MRSHPRFAFRFISLITLTCGGAQAQPLIDNLDQPFNAATVLGTVDPDLIWAAQSFGSPFYYTLVSIEVPMGNAIGNPDAFAELRSGKDPTGPAIATFTLPPLSEKGLEVLTLVPDVSVIIEPDTLYWLVTGAASVGSYEWSYAQGNKFAGDGYFGNYWYSFDFGATWTNYGGDNPYHMRVTVAPLPACTADFNADGFVNSQDFFDFLGAFFAVEPAADINQDTFINSQDFFDFLSAFFAGC